MVTGRQPPVKATCFAGGYSLLFQIFWLRVSQGQIDGLLTLEMLNLLLQFGESIFPSAFGTAAMESYMEAQDSYSALFEDKTKYDAVMNALAGVVYREMRQNISAL